MLDAKILAAVLASLTAVAVSMNGGGINPEVSGSSFSTSNLGIQELSSNPVKSLKRMFITPPEPTNNVKARLEVQNMQNEKIRLEKAEVSPSNLTTIKLGAKKMESDKDITFEGFKGSLKLGKISEIQGSAGEASSSGVSVSGAITVNEKVNSSRIDIVEKDHARLSFSNVEGEITSDSTSTEFRNGTRELNINSFSGRITVFPSNNSVILDGKVDTLNAGELSFGG